MAVFTRDTVSRSIVTGCTESTLTLPSALSRLALTLVRPRLPGSNIQARASGPRVDWRAWNRVVRQKTIPHSGEEGVACRVS